MKKFLGLALALSLMLNVVLLARKPAPPLPPVVRTQVVERTVPPEPPRESVPRTIPESKPVVNAGPIVPPRPPEARATVTLLARPGYASPGEKITVILDHLEGALSPQDWIGLFSVGAPVTRYADYRMAQVESEYTFVAPRTPGQYEFRFVLMDNKTVITSSNPVVVVGAAPVKPMVDLQTSTAYVKCGGEIPANWALLSGKRSTQDWIGLYAAGARNEDFVSWKYVTDADRGQLTLQAPDRPGTYEMRYLLDNGYESVATTIRIVVLP